MNLLRISARIVSTPESRRRAYLVHASRRTADDIEIPAKRGHRQENWILPDGKVVDVPHTHGETAVEILEEQGVKIPMESAGVPDYMAAMGILFKKGAARVHRYGQDIVFSVDKFTSKILDKITDFLIDKNVDMDKNIVLQYGGINNFQNMEVSFEDLLKIGNDPRKLEKFGKTQKYGSKVLLNPQDVMLMRIAARLMKRSSQEK